MVTRQDVLHIQISILYTFGDEVISHINIFRPRMKLVVLGKRN